MHLKLKEILVLVRISEGQFLFLCLTLDISFSSAEYLNIQDYFVVAKWIMGQIGTIFGVAQNSACWIFFICEGAGNGPCNLERLKIHIILVKSMDLMGSLDE